MIRILIADDHGIVRDGLKQIFADTADITVEGEAINGLEVMARIRERDWDVVLMDMSMPGRSGIELIKQVKGEKPALPVLILSMHSEDQYAVRALRAGAAGYLTKETAAEQVVAAVRKVASGGLYVSPGVAERLAAELTRRTDAAPHTLLSDREYQVFQALAAGRSVGAIADSLALSVKTVSTHKTRILQKLNVHNTAELIHYAIRHHLVGEPES
jgi:DNA-binding NarL/FixJ family response regulator